MPIHPAVVHFPIAFYCLELLLLFLWIARHDPAYRRFALFSFRLAYITMIAAMVAGFVDAGARLPVPKPIRPHALSALAVFTLCTLRAGYWQWAKEGGKFYRRILIAGALLGNLLVLAAGFLGGKLVYS